MVGLQRRGPCRRAHRVAFHDEVTPADTATVTGRISGENHPFVEHFKFVKQFEDENTVARQTMPSPAQTRFVLTGNAAAYPYDEFYKNDDELTADIVAAYRQVIADLYAAGCRNVQFDDCTWTRLCDASVRERLGWSDEDALRLQQENLDVINAVIADQPDDPGHQHPRVPRQLPLHLAFLRRLRAGRRQTGSARERDAYYLEFDDDRSGDFAPLAEVSGDKKVVLGLITSKKPDLEDPDTIKARIQEATQYIPLDRLCLSTQCGFASTQEGNKLTEDQQWAKIALVQSIAKDVWGE